MQPPHSWTVIPLLSSHLLSALLWGLCWALERPWESWWAQWACWLAVNIDVSRGSALAFVSFCTFLDSSTYFLWFHLCSKNLVKLNVVSWVEILAWQGWGWGVHLLSWAPDLYVECQVVISSWLSPKHYKYMSVTFLQMPSFLFLILANVITSHLYPKSRNHQLQWVCIDCLLWTLRWENILIYIV